VLDEDGYGRCVGRNKDMIVKVGDKIFPVELEEFFLNHPDVLEAVVRLQYKDNSSNTVGRNSSLSTVT
jgi:acyl-coenzyme A synthetase/AMP-(fatty) acid ligase